MTENNLNEFQRSYVECALAISNEFEKDLDGLDDQDNPGNLGFQNYTVSDFDKDTIKDMIKDCNQFYQDNVRDLIWARENIKHNYTNEQAGYDFWLTRNGHGAGFWDKGLGTVGERLSDSARKFGPIALYIGEGGKIYAEKG